MLPFTGSRYIFLRCAAKNTRTDETVFVSCKQDVTSSRILKKIHIEKFLIHRQNLCFCSLVLNTFFCAALRKTLELTKPFSYRVNKTSLRVIFVKNRIEKFFDWRTKFVLPFTGSRYIFLCCATKNTRTDGATDEGKLIRSINYFPKFFFARLGRSSYRPSINANFFA